MPYSSLTTRRPVLWRLLYATLADLGYPFNERRVSQKKYLKDTVKSITGVTVNPYLSPHQMLQPLYDYYVDPDFDRHKVSTSELLAAIINQIIEAESFSWTISGSGAHNWDDVAISGTAQRMVAIQFAADDGSSKGKLYTSIDRGLTWVENVAAGERFYSSVAISSNGQIIFATTYNETGSYGAGDDGALLRSTNGGTSWSAITVDEEDHRWETVSISTDGQTVALCEYSKSSFELTGSFWLSTTGGGNSSFTQKLGTHYWQRSAISADKQKIIVVSYLDAPAGAGIGGRIQISTDGGANFAQASGDPQDRYQWCAISADGSRYAIASYLEDDGSTAGHIYLSTDGNVWTPVNDIGQQRWSSISISDDGERIVATAFTENYPILGGTFISEDGGATWTEFSGAALYYTASAIAGDGTLAAAAYYDFDLGAGGPMLLAELDP